MGFLNCQFTKGTFVDQPQDFLRTLFFFPLFTNDPFCCRIGATFFFGGEVLELPEMRGPGGRRTVILSRLSPGNGETARAL